MPKQAKGTSDSAGGSGACVSRSRASGCTTSRYPRASHARKPRSARLLAEQAKHLRLAGKLASWETNSGATRLLEELGGATAGEGVTDAIHVIGQFCSASAIRLTRPRT